MDYKVCLICTWVPFHYTEIWYECGAYCLILNKEFQHEKTIYNVHVLHTVYEDESQSRS